MDINTKPEDTLNNLNVVKGTSEIKKDIQAIEDEKQEYLEENPEECCGGCENCDCEEDEEEVEEEKEVDVIEVSFNEDEINEWISKLEELRESKDSVQLEIDEDNDLKINYSEEKEDEE